MKRRNQGGAAAIECAMVLVLLLVLIPVPFYFGKFLMEYNALRKASLHASLAAAQAEPMEIGDSARVGMVRDLARDVFLSDAASARVAVDPGKVTLHCDGVPCGGTLPPNQLSLPYVHRFQESSFAFAVFMALGTEPEQVYMVRGVLPYAN